MALNATPDNLRDEIRAAEEVRDKHLSEIGTLVKRFHGRFWRQDCRPEMPIIDNHAYEFLSVMLPSVVYESPRCKVSALNPDQMDLYGRTTMGVRAKGIQAALNQWSINDRIGGILSDAAVDFFFSWCVFLVTMQDQPGFQGTDLIPQKPALMKLENAHFIMDASAKDADPTRLNGPRLMGHMWKTDREDLLLDPSFDEAQVNEVANDSDLEKYDGVTNRFMGQDRPQRDEIVCWDIWVPERDIRLEPDYDGEVDPRDPAYNGTIYTVACHATNDGISKRTRFIRPPQPAFVPPWGPYVVAGYMKVPGSPYPLSPLVATAEQAEDANQQAVSIARDTKKYKQFATYRTDSPADGQRIKQVRHGDVIGLDNPDGAKEMTVGKVENERFEYRRFAKDMLNTAAGVSDSFSGQPRGNTTATAESIAQSGLQTRTEGIKSKFRSGVEQVFRTAAWYAHHADAFRMTLGEEGRRAGVVEYQGGILPGMEDFSFFDMVLSIDPYSMEHTDQAMLQRRMEQAWDKLIQASSIMAQTPWIKWADVIKMIFEVLNIEDANEWVDSDILAAIQGLDPQRLQAIAAMEAQQAPSLDTPGVVVPAANGDIVSDATINQPRMDAVSVVREQSADLREAMVP